MPEEIVDSKRLVLADGTVLEDCECGYFNKTLWCSLKNIPFHEAFQYFSDVSKFNTVIFEMTVGDLTDRIIYRGLERITAVQQNEFTVDVRLEGYSIQMERQRNHKDGGQAS